MSAFSGSERKCGWPAQKGSRRLVIKSQLDARPQQPQLYNSATAQPQLSHSSHNSATAPLSLPLPLPLPLAAAAAATATETATILTAITAAFFWWSLTVCMFIITSFFTALFLFV
jgi:hypothetical protein